MKAATWRAAGAFATANASAPCEDPITGAHEQLVGDERSDQRRAREFTTDDTYVMRGLLFNCASSKASAGCARRGS
ncbi:hypothetical protein GCM10027597_25970 [Saccharopolyspora tripterygii]